MTKLFFYLWKCNKDAEDRIAKISSSIQTFAKQQGLSTDEGWETKIVDVAIYGDTTHSDGWGVVFGRAIKHVSVLDKNYIIELPEIDLLTPGPENKDRRIRATEALKLLATSISSSSRAAPAQMTLVKDGIRVGKDQGDIIISEEAIKYIKELRDLLGGGDVEITKGDLKVEIKRGQ